MPPAGIEPLHRDNEIETLLLGEFGKVQSLMDDKDYLFSRIALECAPTLQCLKPSTLLCFPRCGRNLRSLWEKYKTRTKQELGLDYFEVNSSANHHSVIFFRYETLAETLRSGKNIAFLRESGYRGPVSVEAVLAYLHEKMGRRYPHEIGLLLGIPAEDIRGFIANQGARCLLCGYWKVYHDPQHAGTIFKAYDNAKKRSCAASLNFIPPCLPLLNHNDFPFMAKSPNNAALQHCSGFCSLYFFC